jgi:hAT family C-terminal dimerisation region
VFNLTCRRVAGPHTAENIRKWIMEIIDEFKIEEKQLLVLAIDSAANIQKAARDYLKELEEKFAVSLEKIPEEDAENEEVELNALIDSQDFECETIEDERIFPAELTTSLPQQLIPTSYKIPCVAHQLQLAIVKFSELPVISNMLETSRRLSAKLRTPTLKNLLDREKLPYGKMDQATRWSSKAAMTSRLGELREFCAQNQDLCAGLKVSQQFWTILEKFNQLVEPFSILTTRLQNEQLTIPDFNQYWITAMMSPAINSDWPPAKKLKELLNARREKIGENPIIHAGIYLDPRFRNFSLNGMNQNSGKQVIRAIFTGNLAVIEQTPAQSMEVESLEDIDPVEALISAQFSCQQSSSTVHPLQQLDDVFQAYEKFPFDKRTVGKLNITEFWREQAQSSAAPLNMLASVALDVICVPVTEVTAERLFSHLNYIFSKHRSSLKSDIIEKILFCRWNKRN